MKITSSAFQNGEKIPKKFSCEGSNINPPLEFQDVPREAKALVLLVEDPDAPSVKPWVHWVVFNIPPNTKSIEENSIPIGSIEGIGTANTFGYEGPCPPSNIHRYFFNLYALNTILDIPAESDRNAVLREMEGVIIAKASLIGLYESEKSEKKRKA